MAAAVELAAAGVSATVFEAAPTLGGRARAVRLGELPQASVDNGQHILVGAYAQTLRLLRLVAAAPEGIDSLLLRLPLTLLYPGQVSIRAARLPAPLHLAVALLGARGLGLNDKFAAWRFMRAMQAQQFRLAVDLSVGALLDSQAQPERLRRYLWEPLCVAALNTPVVMASAQTFLNVLRDTLAGGRAASDLLLPRVDLSRLFPEPAERFVRARGGQVLRGAAVRRIRRDMQGFMLCRGDARDGDAEGQHYAQVIIAVAPQQLAPLVSALPELQALSRQVAAFAWEPIITCYLAYPGAPRLPAAMVGRCDGLMQWLFDRGQCGGPPGLFAAVISARGRHQNFPNAALAAALHEEIATLLPGLAPPLWSRVIRERRATFACVPGLQRPATRTPLAGLWLAGDYVAGAYPATLEAAVRSGVSAAHAALAALA